MHVHRPHRDFPCAVGLNANDEESAVRFVIVCTPSENVKAVGVTKVTGMFGARGAANLTNAVTKSLVV
jgi:hypothetical protein